MQYDILIKAFRLCMSYTLVIINFDDYFKTLFNTDFQGDNCINVIIEAGSLNLDFTIHTYLYNYTGHKT